MSKKLWSLASLVLIAAMILSACATSTQAPAPAATNAPSSPTQPPAAQKVELTIWHAYGTGSNEEKAITQILDAYRAANPNVTLNVLQIPFDQVFNKWETEVAAGGGPDMFTAPDDNFGKEIRAGLIAPIDQYVQGKLTGYADAAVKGMTIDGKMYAIPGIFKAVALYYNKSTVPTPPKTTAELLDMVKSGKKLVLNENAYHNFGFWNAFGQVFDLSTGKCTADTTGVADAFQYLADLKAAGKANGWDVFQTDGGKADTMFRQAQADMIINGPWVLGDYSNDLKENLGVSPMPAGPKGPSTPLMGIDGWFVNPNSKNQQAAVDLALYITNADGQKIYADVAGDPSVRTDVTVSNANVKSFADAAAAGLRRPQSAWFDNYWTPFGDAVTKSVEGTLPPADAVKEACAAMNKANNLQ
jgi:arabinogalactan oligomer/maltooligosaccharide transport system substrate-binding protein